MVQSLKIIFRALRHICHANAEMHIFMLTSQSTLEVGNIFGWLFYICIFSVLVPVTWSEGKMTRNFHPIMIGPEKRGGVRLERNTIFCWLIFNFNKILFSRFKLTMLFINIYWAMTPYTPLCFSLLNFTYN